ncbi:hypothetical protein [Corynebacterium comes]|uniref:Uncharacterized protein n=1 Tax=Corynebacterium comes TaxID=2675218 RepID=A0A6B8VQB4_9CORY|nr:hypothetical protein [Corynebacterium comes]QGU03594.1 hypothetical protein CETAM_01545 [Corynebacterium comes]
MSTIESALGLGSLVAVCGLIVGAIATMAAHLAAVDAAGAAARSHAIGVDYHPVRGEVSVTESGGLATATATVPSPLGNRTHRAVFPVEVR